MDTIYNTPQSPEIFIDDFKTHIVQFDSIDRSLIYMQDIQRIYDIIERQFRCGYCWHFAHMLKNVFNRGEVCWAAPFSHIVWVDIDKMPYDIEGIYRNTEAMYFIPEKYLGDFINSFKHISFEMDMKYTPKCKNDLIEIIHKYCEDNNIVYDDYVERLMRNEYRY